ncbi:hypothetical protein QIS99_02895 [Streptomyces sp. B-S-A8]|uniref:Uncharacterized protein n=1 Tax=Streptomyces solicavernae TaxID=3043614 RepID=A0ABT6RLJ6_9ACTN|nr:hypothetical protein [Streptomyces sp. B-S-A8]MDI3385170.1 hypothetical protein [Streptomyces sp. B-S-A8]
MGATTSLRVGVGAIAAVSAVLLASVSLTACAGPADDGKGGDGKGGAPGHSRSAKPGPRPEPTPKPTPKPSFTAEDGHDIKACADADCEVVTSKPVKVSFDGPGGKTTLSVTEVGPNKVAYTVKSANGQSRGSASGPGQGCITVLHANGSGNTCGRIDPSSPPDPQPDAVVVQLVSGADGTALLHLVSE